MKYEVRVCACGEGDLTFGQEHFFMESLLLKKSSNLLNGCSKIVEIAFQSI